MPQFKLSIRTIRCLSITDSLLEGNEDELYIRVWHQHYSNIVIKEEIKLGLYKPGKVVEINKVIFEAQYFEIESLGFDFFDSDLFSPDDLLGGFILSPKNQMRLGPYSSFKPKDNDNWPLFTFTGNRGHYLVEALFEAV